VYKPDSKERRSLEEKKKYEEILRFWEVPGIKSEEQVWMELEAKLSDSKPQTKVIPFRWKTLASIAAAAVIVFGALIFWPDGSSHLAQSTTIGEQKKIELPDHSIMTLNSMSKAEYASDWSKERTLKLSGEAFFEVEKGSTFSVVTDQGVVEVKGTSFDVFARPEKFRVECRTGKVNVSCGKSIVELTPGNGAELLAGKLVIDQINMDGNDWKTGVFTFSEEPIENVFLEIERQFGITIQRPDFEGKILPFDLVFTTEMKVEQVLEELELATNNNFKLKFNKINDNTYQVANTSGISK
jgi:transmembrane sensor